MQVYEKLYYLVKLTRKNCEFNLILFTIIPRTMVIYFIRLCEHMKIVNLVHTCFKLIV